VLVQAAGFALIPQTWAFLFLPAVVPPFVGRRLSLRFTFCCFPVDGGGLFCPTRRASSPRRISCSSRVHTLLPRWVVGVVLAAITLSGLVLLSSVCLAISPLVTRNVVAGLDEPPSSVGRVVTGLYLALSIVGMAYAGTLIVTQ
jgi:SSS family solute:Na+ symporter